MADEDEISLNMFKTSKLDMNKVQAPNSTPRENGVKGTCVGIS